MELKQYDFEDVIKNAILIGDDTYITSSIDGVSEVIRDGIKLALIIKTIFCYHIKC